MRRWTLLFAIAIIMFIINVDYTAVNLALISMATDLQAPLEVIQWVLSGYVFAWALFVLPAGKFVDKFKKRQVCLFGLFLFLMASLFAALTASAHMLILSRILQGIAGAIYIPTVYALIFLNYDEQERGRAMGLASLGVGLGMAMGPPIAGFLLSYFDWRSLFYINIPIGLLAFYIIYRYESKETISTSSTTPWFPVSLFSSLPFLGCIIGILLEQFGFSTLIVITGLFLQKVMQFTPFMSSLMYLSLSVIFGVIAAIGGSWTDRVGVNIPILSGLFAMAFGSLLFTFLSEASSSWSICALFLILGAGMGFAFSGLNTAILKSVPQGYIGIASSFFIMCALVGNTLGVTCTTWLYEQSSYSVLASTLSEKGVALSSSQSQQLLSYVSNISDHPSSLNTFTKPLQNTLVETTITAFNQGVHQVMLMNLVVCLMAALFYVWLTRRRVTHLSFSAESPPSA